MASAVGFFDIKNWNGEHKKNFKAFKVSKPSKGLFMKSYCHPPLVKALFNFFLILALFQFFGCASMYNPLRPGWGQDSNPIITECETPKDGTGEYPYSKGVNCAERVRNAYLDAGVDDALRSDATALTLIPLSLAAMGFGIAGGSGNAVTGLALGSGALLGWGTWTTSATRRDLYGLGAQAISCVVTASEPLNIPQARITRIKTNREKLLTLIQNLKEEIKNVKESEYAKSNEGKSKADEKIHSANKTLDEGWGALKAVDLAADALSHAGQAIWNATMEVHSLVVSAQIKNANDLRYFNDFLQGTVYGNFQDIIGLSAISTPFGKKEKKKPADEAKALEPDENKEKYDRLINNLENKQMAVINLITELNADLQSISIVDLNSRFASCMSPIKTFQQPKKLLVSPRILQMNPNQERQIKISGGAPPFSIFGDWPDSVSLAISPSALQKAGVISIKTGEKGFDASKTYRLFVEDDEGNTIIVRISVTSTSSAPREESSEQIEDLITNYLNESKDFKPDQWIGVEVGIKWIHSLEGEIHHFSLKVKKAADNSKKLDELKKIAGFKDAGIDINTGKIELPMTKKQMEESLAIIK